jgi:hypothetical protein
MERFVASSRPSRLRGAIYLVVASLLASLSGNATLAADPPMHLQQIDEGRLNAAGIRKLSSRRLTLYTDLPAEQSVDELPAVFDLAFPQWCDYFHVDPRQHDDWRMVGYLMKDRLRFEAAGVLPSDLPQFLNGYTRQYECWVSDQTSDYYRRHLLLHEGTHGFMYTLLGGIGPPWYGEGMAELMGTHRWQDGQLTLNYFPKRPQDVPKLGRIEIIETEFAALRAMRLTDVLNYGPHAHLKVEPYAWSWAAAAFLDNHSRYRERFRRLPKFVTDPDFNRRFAETFAGDAAQLAEEWQVFVSDIAYGYDFNRTQLDFTPGVNLPARGAKATVAADRGWQNTGIRLEAGSAYDLKATGRYQVNNGPPIWWSEPNGVSIHYVHGKPLGVLLAAVQPDGDLAGTSPLAMPQAVGPAAVIRPTHSGTLFLRTNVSDGDLDAAGGTLSVQVNPR